MEAPIFWLTPAAYQRVLHLAIPIISADGASLVPCSAGKLCWELGGRDLHHSKTGSNQPVFGWKSHWQPATGKMSTGRWAGLSQTQILASIPTGLASFGLGNLGFCRRPQDEQISIKLTQIGVTKVSWSTYCGWRRIRVGKRFPFFCSGSEDLPFSKGGFSA